MATRSQGLGPTSGAGVGYTASQAAGGPKAPPALRLGKLSIGKGGGMGPGTALFVLVLAEVGVQVLFRSYFRRAHGG